MQIPGINKAIALTLSGMLLSVSAQSAQAYSCTGIIHGLVNRQTNLHGWRIEDLSGKYQCSAVTGQQFSDITPCTEGRVCRMQFTRYRTEAGWTTYGVTDITVLDEPIYSLGE